MGTDVHAVWQAKKDGKWVDIPSKWEQDRHYFLFAWLADVRNGFGFAGIPTHTPVTPIAAQRGFPEDFEGDDEHKTDYENMDPSRQQYTKREEFEGSIWMGDHSFTWLSADEILTAPKPAAWRTGFVSREFFDAWDGHTAPEEWSGGISGRDIRTAEAPTAVEPTTTHVRIFWKQPDDTLDYFVDEVRRLKGLHGEVRVVMGFDS